MRGHTTWCLGRLADWKYGLWGRYASIPRFCERNAHLCFDGFGDQVAGASSEDGGRQVAVLMTRWHRFLFEEALAWVASHWGERGTLSVERSGWPTPWGWSTRERAWSTGREDRRPPCPSS